MKIIPYKEVQDICFGVSAKSVADKFGKPLEDKVSRAGNKELVYSDMIFRFRPEESALREITLNSEYLNIEGHEVGFVELVFFIAKNDTESFERNGFFVSPKYGMAFDPHCKYYVTVFCKEDLEEWRA